ncbi:hypothetical protein M0R45_035188 [Rubus argutus]|uniref:Secreted protein n=1 Tax=Rubus argutus TaxID=59490 RepID=A0AAW1VT82_RUBAR
MVWADMFDLRRAMMLLLLLNGSVTYCNHKVRAFSSEGMQVVSWAISSVAVYRIVNIKSIKFPWPLRAWWLCSFILSTHICGC